jgi:hypothetical protein
MTKTLFDIVSPEPPANWEQASFTLEVGPRFFGYMALNPGKQVVQARYYELEADSHPELADTVEDLIKQDELLKDKARSPLILYNFPEAQQVPEACFNINTNREIVELLHGDLNRGIILSEKIQGWDLYNVFRVPAEIHTLFQRCFPASRHWHFYSLWLKCSRQQMQMGSDYLSVIFYPNSILVAVSSNRQLQLLQKLAYETAEDIAFHLLNICNQMQLDPEKLPIRLSGMLDASSAVYTEIMKYFGRAEFETYPAATSSPALGEYPSHFFSPLLKLAICEL